MTTYANIPNRLCWPYGTPQDDPVVPHCKALVTQSTAIEDYRELRRRWPELQIWVTVEPGNVLKVSDLVPIRGSTSIRQRYSLEAHNISLVRRDVEVWGLNSLDLHPWRWHSLLTYFHFMGQLCAQRSTEDLKLVHESGGGVLIDYSWATLPGIREAAGFTGDVDLFVQQTSNAFRLGVQKNRVYNPGRETRFALNVQGLEDRKVTPKNSRSLQGFELLGEDFFGDKIEDAFGRGPYTRESFLDRLQLYMDGVDQTRWSVYTAAPPAGFDDKQTEDFYAWQSVVYCALRLIRPGILWSSGRTSIEGAPVSEALLARAERNMAIRWVNFYVGKPRDDYLLEIQGWYFGRQVIRRLVMSSSGYPEVRI